MSLILTMNMSMAASHAGIKNAIDEFQYAMTVEGAALDPAASERTISEFHDRLNSIHASGVSRQEIIDTALESIADARVASELKTALLHIEASKMTPEEADDYLKDAVARSYQQGASWNGVSGFIQILGVSVLMMAFMFGLLYVVTRSSDCPRNYTEEQCVQWDENVKW